LEQPLSFLGPAPSDIAWKAAGLILARTLSLVSERPGRRPPMAGDEKRVLRLDDDLV